MQIVSFSCASAVAPSTTRRASSFASAPATYNLNSKFRDLVSIDLPLGTRRQLEEWRAGPLPAESGCDLPRGGAEGVKKERVSLAWAPKLLNSSLYARY